MVVPFECIVDVDAQQFVHRNTFDGRKERDGQKKKIVKATEKREK